jgi:hypothetical protein
MRALLASCMEVVVSRADRVDDLSAHDRLSRKAAQEVAPASSFACEARKLKT